MRRRANPSSSQQLNGGEIIMSDMGGGAKKGGRGGGLDSSPCISNGRFCISYRLFSNIAHPSSSAGAPRSNRTTALQVDEEVNHGHYPPLSDVCARILHRSS